MKLIDTNEALRAFCDSLKNQRYVTIDTEFMRDSTFWPILCLVQVGSDQDAVAIDPLAAGIDLKPVRELLANPQILKVFHACRQDMEVFYRVFDELPVNVFDTQIAAMFTGFGDEVGYENLVGRIARAQLNKASRFTDWAQRPLSNDQVAYAIGDVTHLRIIFEHLENLLEQRGRRSWVDEELKPYLEKTLYEQDPKESWKRIKFKGNDRRFLALVQELAAWREERAQTRDVPRNRIMRDDIILEIAASKPKTSDDLRNLKRVSVDRQGAVEIIQAVQSVARMNEADLPPAKEHRFQPKGIAAIVDLLRVLLKHVSDAEGIAARLIATTSDLEAIALDDDANVSTMRGWRRELFGETALNVKAGRLGFKVDGGKLAVIDLS